MWSCQTSGTWPFIRQEALYHISGFAHLTMTCSLRSPRRVPPIPVLDHLCRELGRLGGTLSSQGGGQVQTEGPVAGAHPAAVSSDCGQCGQGAQDPTPIGTWKP